MKSSRNTRNVAFPIVANTVLDSAVFLNMQLKRDLETCFTSLYLYFFSVLMLNTFTYLPLHCS